MNSLIKLFLDKLSERIFSLIGSTVGTAATTYHAVQQAEQQSLLEDLARKYEADGKDDVAATLRRQAQCLANGDPAVAGNLILKQVTETASIPALPSVNSEHEPSSVPSGTRSRRARRITSQSIDNSDGE